MDEGDGAGGSFVNKAIRIIKCSDLMMWYRGMVGRTVIFLGEDIDAKGPIYWSRDNGGYKNIILQCDAELIDIEEQSYTRLFQQAKYPS